MCSPQRSPSDINRPPRLGALQRHLDNAQHVPCLLCLDRHILFSHESLRELAVILDISRRLDSGISLHLRRRFLVRDGDQRTVVGLWLNSEAHIAGLLLLET